MYKVIDTTKMNEAEWLKWRQNGLGASDVATVLGLNPYKASIQLFYQLLGEPLQTPENIFQFMGKYNEGAILDLWQYYDGDEETMIANYRAKNIVRAFTPINGSLWNPAYPWLYATPDAEIPAQKGKGRLSLEAKQISGWEAGKWVGDVPPSYVIQVQTQILVGEYEGGELAAMRDGNRFEVLPFEVNTAVQETIITRTKDFWDKVEEGRKLITRRFEAERNFNYKAVEEINEELTTVEPPPDGSEAFAKYLKERYRIAEPGEQSGTDDQLVWAERDGYLSSQIKSLEEERRLMQNQLKNVLRDGADKLTFGPHGYISWKTDAKGVRRFLNKVKSS